MNRTIALCLVTLSLAACGVDGDPEQPTPTDGRPDVTVSGSADAGMRIDVGDLQRYDAAPPERQPRSGGY